MEKSWYEEIKWELPFKIPTNATLEISGLSGAILAGRGKAVEFKLESITLQPLTEGKLKLFVNVLTVSAAVSFLVSSISSSDGIIDLRVEMDLGLHMHSGRSSIVSQVHCEAIVPFKLSLMPDLLVSKIPPKFKKVGRKDEVQIMRSIVTGLQTRQNDGKFMLQIDDTKVAGETINWIYVYLFCSGAMISLITGAITCCCRCHQQRQPSHPVRPKNDIQWH